MCKSASRFDLVLISFRGLTTSSIFSNQTLEIQQRLQILGFGGLLALKVLQIPGFGRLLALKVLQIPGFGGSHCTESAANSRTWGPDTVNFQALGARVHESNVNTGPSVINCEGRDFEDR